MDPSFLLRFIYLFLSCSLNFIILLCLIIPNALEYVSFKKFMSFQSWIWPKYVILA